MKRLFQVVREEHGFRQSIRVGSEGPVYRESKQEAKAIRDACNIAHGCYNDKGELVKPLAYIVTRGPDHWKNS